MEHLNVLCHIVGLDPLSKKELINSIDSKIFHTLDLEFLNQEIFDNTDMRKLFKQYQEFKKSKNDKYKDIDRKMTNFWEKNMLDLIEQNIPSKKKTIIVGYNNHFRNISKKVNIPTNNRFIIEVTNKSIRNIIKYNLDKNYNDIVKGIYPLENIDFNYLLKNKKKISDHYIKSGYLTKTIEQVTKILELSSKQKKFSGLWIGLSQPYNIASKIYPKKNDKIFAYTEPIHALLGSFKWNDDEVEKKYKGDNIKLIQKKDDSLDKLKQKRFLYYVDDRSFIPHEKGNNIKFFSQVPVTILEKEKIDNVYRKFEKLGIFS